MKKAVSSARTSMLPLFSSIIRENHAKMMGLDLRVRDMKQDLTFEMEDELAKSSIIVIVFSAMAVEAYIYDYAARNQRDAFVKDHLDKLDTLSKWVIIPKLVTGKELPRRENWRELLTKLVKTRNSIIHHKSSDPSAAVDAKKYLKKLSDEPDIIFETAKQSITLLDALADKIIEIDPEESPWVKSYLA